MPCAGNHLLVAYCVRYRVLVPDSYTHRLFHDRIPAIVPVISASVNYALKSLHCRSCSGRLIEDHQIPWIFKTNEEKKAVFINCWKQPTFHRRTESTSSTQTRTCFMIQRWCGCARHFPIKLKRALSQACVVELWGKWHYLRLGRRFFSGLTANIRYNCIQHLGNSQHALLRMSFPNRAHHITGYSSPEIVSTSDPRGFDHVNEIPISKTFSKTFP